MRFAVCDDQENDLEKIYIKLRKYLDKHLLSVKIDLFSRGDALTSSPHIADYDLVLLDVNMERINGIDVARELRKINQKAVLMYISELAEFARMGYEVRAFRYILKQDMEASFERCMDAAWRELQKRKRTFAIKTDCGDYIVPLKNILYVECVQKRQVAFHLQQSPRNVCTYYEKLSSIEEKLSPVGFLRISKGFLVNMEHIEYIGGTTVTLSDKTVIKMSETNKKELIRAFFLWKGNV